MDFDSPPSDPIAQFTRWLDEAGTLGLVNPHAMALATVDPDGRPSARTVLLKSIDEHGAVFFTNCRSRKGEALAAHPHAALLLYWDRLHRQVCFEGRVSEVDDEEADAYFASRPRGAQLGAWASDQSRPIDSRAQLEAQIAEVTKKHEGRDIPRPPYWGGYRVHLETIEFWQGREDRLHDRLVYLRDAGGTWTTQRLSP